jgi:hypothetical protein
MFLAKEVDRETSSSRLRVWALAFRLMQTSKDGGLSDSEQADVTVKPVRSLGLVPTVTSATAPAHWRMACLKIVASIFMA